MYVNKAPVPGIRRIGRRDGQLTELGDPATLTYKERAGGQAQTETELELKAEAAREAARVIAINLATEAILLQEGKKPLCAAVNLTRS